DGGEVILVRLGALEQTAGQGRGWQGAIIFAQRGQHLIERVVLVTEDLRARVDALQQAAEGLQVRRLARQRLPRIIEVAIQVAVLEDGLALLVDLVAFVILLALQDEEGGDAAGDAELLAISRRQRLHRRIIQRQKRSDGDLAPGARRQFAVLADADGERLSELAAVETPLDD